MQANGYLKFVWIGQPYQEIALFPQRSLCEHISYISHLAHSQLQHLCANNPPPSSQPLLRPLISTIRPSLRSDLKAHPPKPKQTMFSTLSTLQPRQLLTQVLNFALVLSTAFMLWKGLSVATDSPSPIVVVLSGSMEPAFQRGDLLFLWNRGAETQIGEVVVYNVKGKDIPIVHRVVRRFGGG